jgi:hypothetical protein
MGGIFEVHAHVEARTVVSDKNSGGIFFSNSDLGINTVNTVNKASKNQALRCGGWC